MDVLEIVPAASAKAPRVEHVLYALENFSGGLEAIEGGLDRLRNRLVPAGLHRDKPLDAHDEILESWIEEGALCLRLRAHESGSTVSPYAVFGLVLGVDPEDLRSEALAKIDFAMAGNPVGNGPVRPTLASASRKMDDNE
jgi:hypothetical protein